MNLKIACVVESNVLNKNEVTGKIFFVKILTKMFFLVKICILKNNYFFFNMTNLQEHNLI